MRLELSRRPTAVGGVMVPVAAAEAPSAVDGPATLAGEERPVL